MCPACEIQVGLYRQLLLHPAWYPQTSHVPMTAHCQKHQQLLGAMVEILHAFIL